MLFKKKTLVLLDTNILLLPGQKAVDIFTGIKELMDEPYQLGTVDRCLDELERLMAKKSQDGFSAKLGFILSKQKALKILSCSSTLHADDCLVEKSVAKSAVVITQDKALIERLRAKGVRCARYQQHKFLFQR